MADRLELLAFNSLPGTQTADGWGHQYDQQANQVYVSNEPRSWSSNSNESNVFGVEPNFGCCTANMHQGWGKFTQSLWMASKDAGLVAISYAPCTIEAKVGKGQIVRIINETDYPFKENIKLSIKSEKPGKFPIYLRIPTWCKNPKIAINSEVEAFEANDFIRIERKWKEGDVIDIHLPMEIEIEERYNKAVSVKTGPLYFSTQIEKKYSEEDLGQHSHDYPPAVDWKIEALSSWNYGLIIDMDKPANSFKINRNPVGPYPFADSGDPVYDEQNNKYKINKIGTPISLEVKAKLIPDWTIVNNSAGETPLSPVDSKESVSTIVLVPYAMARLRISEFPLIKSEFTKN
jgi:hypothetical protein